MSVLIKGYKMPKNCLECPLQYGGWCNVSPPDIDERVAPTTDEAAQGRAEWCPLIEVSADVAPVVHGRWNWTGSVVWWKCSVCECEGYENFKFCPHCGAKMDESEGKNNGRV